MSKSNIAIVIYITGLIFGAIFLDIWSADINPRKALLGVAWTAAFAIALYYSEKNNN